MGHAILILGHASLGVFAGFLLLWAFADLLNLTAENVKRMRITATLGVILGYLGLILGLAYYLPYYGKKPNGDKFIIKGGDWYFAHTFFTESKEHFAIMGFFLMIIVLIYIWNVDLVSNESARKATLILMATLVIGVIILEGYGAIMAYGLRIGLGA